MHLVLTSTISNSTESISNYGKDFYIGFMSNYLGTTNALQLVVSTDSNSPVEFTVNRFSGEIYTGTTIASSPVTVSIPTTLVTNGNNYAHRNKGIHVFSTGQGSISVLAINYNDGSNKVGEYLAYPQEASGAQSYEYYAVSTSARGSLHQSQFLLIGYEDNTTITITPTHAVRIPADAQSPSSLQLVASGVEHQIILNKMQTLLIRKNSVDLTGSRIVSNKPLTVISGHQCGNVPSTQQPCEHLTQQIPPTSTWGREFLLVPFGGRNVGQYYKIVSSQNMTTVVQRCNSLSFTHELPTAGNFISFSTSSITYCYLMSTKPVLVVQLGIGSENDGIGGPIISILPSLNQYTNHYSFFSLNTSDFNIHQISVSVLAQYYQPNSIRLDGQPISCSWRPIYNIKNTIIGYGCHRNVTGGMTHVVSHYNPRGKLAVLVHGWSSSGNGGYGYRASFHQQSGMLMCDRYAASHYNFTQRVLWLSLIHTLAPSLVLFSLVVFSVLVMRPLY